MPPEVKSLTQATYARQAGQVPLQFDRSGLLKFEKSDFKQNSIAGHKYANIADAIVNREKNPQALENIDISDLHSSLKAIDNAQTEPGFKRNFKSLTSWIKDSKVGRFFTKSVIPKFTTTKVDGLTISARALSGGRTQLTIQATGTESTFEAQGDAGPQEISQKSISDDNKIVTEYDKLRNLSWWEKNIRGIKRLSPEESIARMDMDITRQARLRNCGIGYTSENRFNTANSGLVKTLNNPNSLKLSDFTMEELQNLQDFYSKLSTDLPNDFPQLKNNKIEQIKSLLTQKNEQIQVAENPKAREGEKKTARKQLVTIEKQIKKADISFLKPLVVAAQIRQIKALVNAFGTESLTQDQNVALDKFAVALGFKEGIDGNKRFDAETFQSALLDFEQTQAIQELALMTSEALRSGHPKNAPNEAELKDHSNNNLKNLLEWEDQGIAPLALLVSAPWFFSPKACDQQAANLQRLNQVGANPPESLKKYLAEGNPNLNQNIGDHTDAAIGELKKLKDNRAGLYRWQGLMPLFADNNEDKINQAFSDQLENTFAQTTGLNKGTSRRMIAGGLAVAGGIGAVVQAAKGNTRAAALLAGGTGIAALAAGKTKNEKKYAERLGLLTAGIVHGLVRGTVQQLDKANQALAQAKIDELAEQFVEAQTNLLLESQNKIESLQEFSSLDSDLDKLLNNERVDQDKGKQLDKSTHLAQIRSEIQKKIHDAQSETRKANEQGQRLGFDSGQRERIENSSLKEKPLSPLNGPEKIHDKLMINPGDVSLDPEIAQKLREFNDITLKNAQGLEKSFGIVQDAYKEGGAIHSKILGIENDLTALFEAGGDSKKLCEVPAEQIQNLVTSINELRGEISGKAALLTNEHAAHLHALIDALDAKAGRLVEAKFAMNRIATAFANGSDDYLDGKDPDSNRLETDLKFLEGLRTNSDNKKDLLLFGEEQIDKAFQEGGPVATFLNDAQSAAKDWKDYRTHQKAINEKSAHGGNFDNDSLINGLHIELKKCKVDADNASQKLNVFSNKYIGADQANYTNRTTEIYLTALLDGGARLIGNVPVNDQTRHGLSILVSQFGTNESVQKKISAYILQDLPSDGPAIPSEKIQQRFVELFEGLPTFEIHQIDDPAASVKWKAELSSDQALAFIAKIEPGYRENSKSLQGAIDIAKAFEGGVKEDGGIGKVSASIHREHINNQFEKVIKSDAIMAIYQPLPSLPVPDVRRVLQNHAGSLDTLAKYGYDQGKFNKAKSDLDLLQTYDKFEKNESLNEAEYNLLSVVGEGLANLQDKPDVTKQLRLRAEVFALLAKAKSELAQSSDFSAIDDSQIGNFEFKPINQGEKFAKLNSQIDLLQKELAKARQASHAAETSMNQALENFVKEFGGDPSVRENFERDPQMRDFASQLVKIADAYKRGTGKSRESLDQEIALNRLTENYDPTQLERSYNAANSRKTIANIDKQVHRDTLRYVDISRLALNYELKNQDDFIQADKKAARLSIFTQFVLPTVGTAQFRVAPREVSNLTKSLDLAPRIYKESMPETIQRLFSSSDAENQIEALREASDAFGIAQEKKKLADDCQKMSQVQTGERDKLLKASDRIAYQQAVKAATVKSLLYDNNYEPASLVASDHKQHVLEQLKSWGWKDEQLSIEGEIEQAIRQIQTARGIPPGWQDEMVNNQTALKQQIQQIEALSNQSQKAILSIMNDFSAYAHVAENLLDATNLSEQNQLSLLQLQNLNACLRKPNEFQPLSVAKGAISVLVEKAKTSFPGQGEGIESWQKSLLLKLENENPQTWPDVSKIVAAQITLSDGDKSLSDICFGSDERNSVVPSQDLLSSIYKRAFEAESQKLLHAQSAKFVQAEIKTTTGFDRQISALRNQAIGEIFKQDESGNSLLYKEGKPRTWIQKSAEKLQRSPADVAAEISGMTLEQFQEALKDEHGLGGVLRGKEGKRLKQAQAFFADLQALRMGLSNDLQKVKTGQMTWGDFISTVNLRLQASADSVGQSTKFGEDAMNSLAKVINKSQKPLKTNLYQELESLQKLIKESPYSPEKLGDLATAYDRAEASLVRYRDDKPSPYDPARLAMPAQEELVRQSIVDESEVILNIQRFA